MTRRMLVAFVVTCITGCGSTSLSGDALSEADGPVDAHDPGAEPGPDGTCVDRDGDGHPDEACGGDDCDDTRDDVYPGAPEVCVDGVDQDCDGIVDGIMHMGPDTVVAGPDDAYGCDDVIWTGSEYAVLWTDLDSLNLSRVRAGGTLVGDPVMVSEVMSSVRSGSGVWTGSALAVVWERDAEVELGFFDGEGARIGTTTRLTHDPWWSASPHVDWTGSEVVVAWMDARVSESDCTMTSCFSDSFITRASADGVEIGDDLLISDTSRSGAWPGLAWALWTGSGLGVFWGRKYASADPVGTESGPDTDLPAYEIIVPVWAGSEFGLGWMRGSEEGVFVDRIDAAGSHLGSVQVTADGRTSDVSIAWTGSEYALVWSHYGDVEPCGIYLALVGPGDSSPREVVEVTGCNTNITTGALVWTGSVLGVAWRRFGTGVALTRIGMCD